MKKVSGLIALIVLLVAIFMGLGYKMIEPDGWDRIVQQVTGQATPAPTAQPTEQPSVVPSAPPAGDHGLEAPDAPDKSDKKDDKPKATPTPSPTVSPSPSVSPSPAPEAEEKTEYEKYIELSGAEQQKIFESYTNPQDFFDWYNAAKKEYDDKNQAIIVDGGVIDLEEIVGNEDENTQQ